MPDSPDDTANNVHAPDAVNWPQPIVTWTATGDVWVCSRFLPHFPTEILGIYFGDDAEERAVARCRQENDSVCPVPVNTDLPEEVVMSAWYFPLNPDPAMNKQRLNASRE